MVFDRDTQDIIVKRAEEYANHWFTVPGTSRRNFAGFDDNDLREMMNYIITGKDLEGPDVPYGN